MGWLLDGASDSCRVPGWYLWVHGCSHFGCCLGCLYWFAILFSIAEVLLAAQNWNLLNHAFTIESTNLCWVNIFAWKKWTNEFVHWNTKNVISIVSGTVKFNLTKTVLLLFCLLNRGQFANKLLQNNSAILVTKPITLNLYPALGHVFALSSPTLVKLRISLATLHRMSAYVLKVGALWLGVCLSMTDSTAS